MEWIEALRGTVVGLDTAPLIYFIEENPSYLHVVRPFFEAVDRGEFRVITSILTLTEVLVHPLRQGDHELAHKGAQLPANPPPRRSCHDGPCIGDHRG